jgi:hypothetical protein
MGNGSGDKNLAGLVEDTFSQASASAFGFFIAGWDLNGTGATASQGLSWSGFISHCKNYEPNP